MRILLINSSFRKNGATAKILNEILRVLETHNDVEASILHLSDFKLDYCKGCSRCFQTGKCYLQDDAEHISNLIAEADAVVVGAPTYASSIPGQMKTLIDRGHFVMEQLLHGKYTLSVATYENADGISVIKSLNKLFLYSGAVLSGNICIKTAFNQDPLNSQSKKDNVRKQAERLYWNMTKGEKGNIINRIIHHIVFHVGIKPFVLKEKTKYAGVLDHWKRRGIFNATI